MHLPRSRSGVSVSSLATLVDETSLFDFLDVKQEGWVTRVKWATAFDKLDVNKDGSVSRQEWTSRGGEVKVYDAIKATTGARGNLLRKEWLQAFDDLDEDQNERVSREEFQAAQNKPISRRTSARRFSASKPLSAAAPLTAAAEVPSLVDGAIGIDERAAAPSPSLNEDVSTTILEELADMRAEIADLAVTGALAQIFEELAALRSERGLGRKDSANVDEDALPSVTKPEASELAAETTDVLKRTSSSPRAKPESSEFGPETAEMLERMSRDLVEIRSIVAMQQKLQEAPGRPAELPANASPEALSQILRGLGETKSMVQQMQQDLTASVLCKEPISPPEDRARGTNGDTIRVASLDQLVGEVQQMHRDLRALAQTRVADNACVASGGPQPGPEAAALESGPGRTEEAPDLRLPEALWALRPPGAEELLSSVESSRRAVQVAEACLKDVNEHVRDAAQFALGAFPKVSPMVSDITDSIPLPARTKRSSIELGYDLDWSKLGPDKPGAVPEESVAQGQRKSMTFKAEAVPHPLQRKNVHDEELRGKMVAAARDALQELTSATTATQAALGQLVGAEPPVSQSGYLTSLEDLIGPSPMDKDWRQDELPAMLAEECRRRDENFADVQKQYSIEAYEEDVAFFAGNLDIPEEDAVALTLLGIESYYIAPMARALRERDGRFAGATHYIYNLLAMLANRAGRKRGLEPRTLFWHLRGRSSLVADDPAWNSIEEADATGFRCIVSSAIISASCHVNNVSKQTGVAPGPDYEPVDSDVICFEPAPVDGHGTLHSPIMLSIDFGVFPPNTMFRLKKILPAPCIVQDHKGDEHVINQRCLVVSATFLPFGGSVGSVLSRSRMTGPAASLLFGSRHAYMGGGLHDVIMRPVLTMEQEFQRGFEWTDWTGAAHTLRASWEYVSGPAVRNEDLTLGIRDDTNHGMYPESFQSMINAHIQSRRAEGYGLDFSEDYAELSLLEVLSVRLYTGPASEPINRFLREVSNLHGSYRNAVRQHADLTFAATVGHLSRAIHKIAAVATPEESRQPLFRGVQGVLPKGFWYPDRGVVSATECTFMSTSRALEIPARYMGPADSIIWELCPQEPSETAQHFGADVGMLSQYPADEEVLFPPYTVLVARQLVDQHDLPPRRVPPGNADVVEGSIGDKRYVAIRVIPSFQ